MRNFIRRNEKLRKNVYLLTFSLQNKIPSEIALLLRPTTTLLWKQKINNVLGAV